MLKSFEVYSENFASKVAGIAGKTALGGLKLAAGTAGFAARQIAPDLMDMKDQVTGGIKKAGAALGFTGFRFREPQAALKDLFKQNPDKFRGCELVKLVKDSAAGVVTEASLVQEQEIGDFRQPTPPPRLPVPPPAMPRRQLSGTRLPNTNNRNQPSSVIDRSRQGLTRSAAATANKKYKGSYKAIFKGSVKAGNEANSPLVYSNNFSVTILPSNARNEGDIKYMADKVVFKDDKEFTDVIETVNPAETNYFNLFKIDVLKNKFILNRKPNFYPLGNVQKGNPSKGTKLNFDGTVTFAGKPTRPIADDEYIIFVNNSGKLQSDGKLYKGTREMNESENINYNQKNILIESEKLVDLFCK